MTSDRYLLGRRGDLSNYLVHLTRKYNGRLAVDNIHSILKARTIHARNAHCIFNSNVEQLPYKYAKHFRAVCFTETPLSELNYVTQEMEGRSIKLSQYGLVFARNIIQKAGGNSVFYLDTRSADGKERCKAVWRFFNQAKIDKFDDDSSISILPLINKVGHNIDFSWEREWRIVRSFKFVFPDIFLGLCPDGKIDEFESKYPEIHWISPRWGRDQIIEKLRG
jgi:hypothetical protein